MPGDVTALIDAANQGDASARERLFGLVYGELKLLARKQLRGMPSATLETTGLVHEAYLKLVRSPAHPLHGRAHFFALSAKIMRQIVRLRKMKPDDRSEMEMLLDTYKAALGLG